MENLTVGKYNDVMDTSGSFYGAIRRLCKLVGIDELTDNNTQDILKNWDFSSMNTPYTNLENFKISIKKTIKQ